MRRRDLPATPPADVGPSRTLLEHVQDALRGVDALPATGTPPGAGDEELHGALPAGLHAAAFDALASAQQDPRYATLRREIARYATAVQRARDRLRELVAIHEEKDLTTSFAEQDGESGWFIAEATERATEAAVLVAALIDAQETPRDFLEQQQTPAAERDANDRLLDRISAAEGARRHGPAKALHRYLVARRTGSDDQDDAARELLDVLTSIARRLKQDDPEAWASNAVFLVTERIDATAAFRRAEIKPAVLLSYLKSYTPRDNHSGDRLDSRRRAKQEVLSLDAFGEADDAEGALLKLLADPDDVLRHAQRWLELADQVAAAGLTDRERDVFALMVVDLSAAEIAHRLGIRPGTAGVLVARVKAKLRRGDFEDT
jgi:DNA-binding NarL/FixJ family response regulator